MAKSKQKQQSGAPNTGPAAFGRSLLWVQGLLCGAAVAWTPGIALLFGLLLAPALAVLMIERAPGRPVVRTMLLFGLSTSVSPAIALWKAGASTGAATALAFEPRTLALAWAAQGFGWLLTELLPVAVRIGLDAAALARRTRLRGIRDRCAEEWGLTLTDGDPAAE